MAVIKTTFGSGGAGLAPGGASGSPSLATVLRDAADDLADLKPGAVAATDDGVIGGLVAGAPTTPSSQITGSGNTTWNIDITAGDVVVSGVEKHEAAATDFAVHSGSKLLNNGQSAYAWLLEKNDAGTLSTVAVKGTAATTGAETAPTDGAIQTALGAGVTWVKLALLHLSRTADTVVAQTQANKYREAFGAKGCRTAINAVNAKTIRTTKG